jgi:hypothetical protein
MSKKPGLIVAEIQREIAKLTRPTGAAVFAFETFKETL